MGIRINTNISSLNAQRNLGNSEKMLQQSLERLSSGSRINHAGDDAAGLAISEGLNAQVLGLAQAVRNANDGVGFLNTAEGALGESTQLTERIRELAVQAANGTISDNDRANLNAEAQQLIQQFNAIATQTNFNGVFLLDGTFGTQQLQVGTDAGETISFSIGDARASQLGSQAIQSGVQNSITGAVNGLVLNGVTVPNSTTDGVSTGGASYSALAVANAVNSVKGQTGVTADVLSTDVTIHNLNFANFNGNLQSGEFVINGVNITGNAPNINQLIVLINQNANSTGVQASLAAGTNADIQLTASDGRNIQLALSSTANGVAVNSSNFWAVVDYSTNFSSGGAFSTVASSALSQGSSRILTGAVQLRSSSAVAISGANNSSAVGFSQTSVAVTNATALSNVKISSQGGASSALSILDVVLVQLTNLRSSLGAVQNRLGSTSNVLEINSENLSAAQSQIKDADLALETANFTKAQILTQAGVAVLAQANTTEKQALQLLQFGQ